jgi:cysteine synthase A
MAEAARKTNSASAHVPGRGRIYDSITDTIGDTPIVRLRRLEKDKGIKANLLAKLEFFNPIGSVKDRIGVSMIDALEAEGLVKAGTTLIEHFRQYRHRAGFRRGTRLPADPGDAGNDVDERRKMPCSAGWSADPRPAGHARRHPRAEELMATIPGAVIPQQFRNPANPDIHRRTTAEGIWNDTKGRSIISSPAWHRRRHHRRRPGAEAAQAVAKIIGRAEDSPVLRTRRPGPTRSRTHGAGGAGNLDAR